MIEKKPKVEPQDVLGPEDLQLLSKEAGRIYASIWQSMDNLRVLTIYVKDEEISWRARVVLPAVNAARAELVQAGLLTAGIHSDRDGNSLGANYTFVT
jgi:hypothetical protein